MDIDGVRLLRWAPRRPFPLRPRRAFAWTKRLPGAPRVKNFGDLLSEQVVHRMRKVAGCSGAAASGRMRVIAAVGSILHWAPSESVIWGTGVNGKHLGETLASGLDLRAVRGPLTRELLVAQGHSVPEVYGDPGLLVPELFSDLVSEASQIQGVGILGIPNLNDLPSWQDVLMSRPAKGVVLQSPQVGPEVAIRAIAAAEAVVTSSLHGYIIAEALGKPVSLVTSPSEPEFKYRDYVEGTGRTRLQARATLKDAVGALSATEFSWNSESLKRAFPAELWKEVRR